MKKAICVFLCLLILLFSLCACETEVKTTGPVTLNVIAEHTTGSRYAGTNPEFTDVLLSIVADFNLTHEKVQVELEFLPTDQTERKVRLQKLRTELMAGDGPDAFLLPCGFVAGTQKGNEEFPRLLEPLFLDVEMAMRNYSFADLSEYYDADEELKTEELQQDVMDAGVLDSARYALPLGFTMPVFCYAPEKMKKAGITEEDLQAPLGEFLTHAAESGNLLTERSAWLFPLSSLCLFQPLFEYEKEKILIQWETIDSISKQKRKLAQDSADFFLPIGYTSELNAYLSGKFKFSLEGSAAFFMEDLCAATDALGMGQSSDCEVKIVPVRTIDGSVSADVTFFGAVNANCKYPAEAYEFLRTFLLEEVQHQTGIGTGSTRLKGADTAWPVRVTGSVETKWKARKHLRSNEDKKRRELVEAVSLSDRDLPFLFETIEHVQFQLPIAQNSWYGQWIDRIDCADWTMEQLEYHIAEG